MTDNANDRGLRPARFVRNKNVSPDELVREAANVLGEETDGSGIFVLAHTPQCARFLMLRDGKLCDERDRDWTEISQAFELRLFCREAEIAWRRDGQTGRAVLTRDDGGQPPAGWGDAPIKDIEKLADGERLLWGEPNDAASLKAPLAAGWWQLTSPRVGSIHVPLQQPASDGAKRRAILKVVEYVRVAEDGNMVPAGERLKGFCWRETNGEASS